MPYKDKDRAREKGREYSRLWREKHPEKVKEVTQRWKENNREKYLLTHRRKNLAVKFGITLQDYDNMLEGQSGVCAICLRPENAKRLAVDHNHDTGNVRGLLCNNCNNGLGRFGDSVEMLERAIEYLKREQNG